MPCTVVVGGQFGSEGKGKVSFHLAKADPAPWIVRCGGPNSGHSTMFQGAEVVVRQLPAAIAHPQSTALIPAGGAINESVLVAEIHRFGLARERIVVDPRAILITDGDREWEKANLAHISSTFSGTGAAQIRRLQRRDPTVMASTSKVLNELVRIEPVAPLLHKHLDAGGSVFVEGSQGFGLSLLHGLDFPFVTSRDTTAAGAISEVGLAPRDVNRVIVVVRTCPIRTGDHGRLPNESTWSEIYGAAGDETGVVELASVTRRPRRVGRFDHEAVRLACRHNGAAAIAVMGLDRLDVRDREVAVYARLTPGSREFIDSVSLTTGVPVVLAGTGMRTEDVVWVPQR